MAAEFTTIHAEAARARTGSDLVRAGDWGFINNLLPVDLANDRTPLPEQVEAQTRKVLGNLETVLKSAGLTRNRVVAVRIALVDLPRLEERMETGYTGFFDPACLPVRSLVGVASLPRGALIAMDFTLHLA